MSGRVGFFLAACLDDPEDALPRNTAAKAAACFEGVKVQGSGMVSFCLRSGDGVLGFCWFRFGASWAEGIRRHAVCKQASRVSVELRLSHAYRWARALGVVGAHVLSRLAWGFKGFCRATRTIANPKHMWTTVVILAWCTSGHRITGLGVDVVHEVATIFSTHLLGLHLPGKIRPHNAPGTPTNHQSVFCTKVLN